MGIAWAVVPAEAPVAPFGRVSPFGVLDEFSGALSGLRACPRDAHALHAVEIRHQVHRARCGAKGSPRRETKKTVAKYYGGLAAFGVAHPALRFFGDIMLSYGLIAMVAILPPGRNDRSLSIITGIVWPFMAVGFVLGSLSTLAKYLGHDPTEYLPDSPNTRPALAST